MSETGRIAVPFERRHFDRDVVALCVRWYLGPRSGPGGGEPVAFRRGMPGSQARRPARPSLREAAGMMAERGLPVSHTTPMRRTRRCTPASGTEQHRLGRSPERPWRVEAGLTKSRGAWRYLHRAVDSADETLDFWFGDRHDAAAAEAFFSRTLSPRPNVARPCRLASLDAPPGRSGKASGLRLPDGPVRPGRGSRLPGA